MREARRRSRFRIIMREAGERNARKPQSFDDPCLEAGGGSGCIASAGANDNTFETADRAPKQAAAPLIPAATSITRKSGWRRNDGKRKYWVNSSVVLDPQPEAHANSEHCAHGNRYQGKLEIVPSHLAISIAKRLQYGNLAPLCADEARHQRVEKKGDNREKYRGKDDAGGANLFDMIVYNPPRHMITAPVGAKVSQNGRATDRAGL